MRLYFAALVTMVVLGATTVFFYAERKTPSELHKPVAIQPVKAEAVTEAPRTLPEIEEPIVLLPESEVERGRLSVVPMSELIQTSYQNSRPSVPMPRFDSDSFLRPWMPYAEENIDLTYHAEARILLEHLQAIAMVPWQTLHDPIQTILETLPADGMEPDRLRQIREAVEADDKPNKR